MTTWIRTRAGHEAAISGRSNRFGFTPYKHELSKEQNVTVWHDREGRAVEPADEAFDSSNYVKREKVERDNLASRRQKNGNWI